MKCLVTGATGFIGRHLCQQLAVHGESVIALSRSGASLPDGTPTQALDLTVRIPDQALLEGVDVVFHLAGIAHQQARSAAYRELNQRATLNLAHAAAAAGVRCFVFVSSVKAMGPARNPAVRTEQDCSEPTDPYGLSKWQAECGLREAFASSPMAVVILRPALVYGAGAKGNLARLARAVRAGLPRPPAGGARSMIAQADLVTLMAALAGDPPPGVHTWIACDGKGYSTRDLYDRLRRAGGRGVGAAWLPRWVWWLGAALLDSVSAPGGESTFERLFGTELYSNEALLAATDWRPQVTLEEEIGAMLEAPL